MGISDFLNSFSIALNEINANLPFLFFWMLLACVILAANFFLANTLFIFGLLPRHPIGLIGIFTSPFIHGSVQHLFMNAFFYLGLGGLVLSQGLDTFISVSVLIIFFSGSLVWIFGRKALHVGASSLIIGYWAYLCVRAIVDPNPVQISGALIGMYYFGIHIAGSLLSTEDNVSIEGHVAGLIAGLITGYYFTDLFDWFTLYGVDILDAGFNLSSDLNSLVKELGI